MTASDSPHANDAAPATPTTGSGRRSALARRASRWALPVTCLVLLAQVSPYWYATRDGAAYLSIARSLAAGDGPTNLGREQLFFAPGYSVIVAPAYWISEYPFLWLSLLHAALGVAWLFLCRAWFKQLSCFEATLLAATCVVNASAGIVLRRTLSEALFMPGLMATALALNHLRAATRERLPPWTASGVALALAALALTRQAGLTLLPAFCCALFVSTYRREIPWVRAMIVMTIVAVPALSAAWALGAYERSTAASEALTYADYLRLDAASLAEQFVSGVRMRTSEIGRIVIPGMFKSSADGGGFKLLNLALYVAATIGVSIGWLRALRESHDTLLWAAPFYLALYVMWPFDEGIRFLVPLAPIWFLGLYRALPRNEALRERFAALLWAAHLAVGFGSWAVDDLRDARHDAARWTQIESLAASIDRDRDQVGWLPPKTDRQRVMLQYALDRAVADLVAFPEKKDEVVWLIARTNESPPAGFAVAVRTAEFALLRRDRESARETRE